MAISYPVSLPSVRGPRRVMFDMITADGLSSSPFSLSQQVFEHQGEMWAGTLELGNMNRAEGEDWVAFLASLKGRVGTFLLGDPLGTSPRGTWAGSPLMQGAHAARLRTLTIDGFTPAATGKAGDWMQFGTGASSRLHKVIADFTANGSGVATVEIWPALRDALADNDAFVTSSAKGVFRSASSRRSWSIEDVRISNVQLPFIEAL